MKKLCLFLTLAVISIGCEGEVVHYPDDDCVDWQIQVQIGQKIRLIDRNNEWIDDVDNDLVRIIPTSSDWSPLLNQNGQPIEQVPNGIEAKIILNSSNEFEYMQLWLGRTYESKDIDEKKCYFLLRINENTYHQIVAEYYTDCGDFILTKFHYNGTEYTANDWEIINIVVD